MTQTEATDQTAADYLQHALEDLTQARRGAQAERRAAIESAAERTREVLHDLKGNVNGNVTGRAEELQTRRQEQTWEWQRELEEASDEARLELGIEVVARSAPPRPSTPWRTRSSAARGNCRGAPEWGKES